MHKARDYDLSSCELVKALLEFSVARQPSIPEELKNGINFLTEDLLDWDLLVDVDFVREWAESIDILKDENDVHYNPLIAQFRETYNTLPALYSALMQWPNNEAVQGDVICSLIALGNVIEDAIHTENPTLTHTIQRLCNYIYRAGYTAALKEKFPEESFQVAAFEPAAPIWDIGPSQ